MIALILAGAAFLTLSMGYIGLPRHLAEWIGSLGLTQFWQLLVALMLFFMLLGCFLDGISMVVLTMGVILPTVQPPGIDPLWFGIFVVLVVEMAQITPPVGFNLFVHAGHDQARDRLDRQGHAALLLPDDRRGGADLPLPADRDLPARADALKRQFPPQFRPTPPFAVYPPPACAIEPEPCEIEGMNGKILHGRLVEFDLERLTALLQVPASRNPVPVRFAQFRRLMLLQPLPALPAAARDPLQRPDSVPYQVLLKGLPALQGRTVGHREDDYGLFLFEPVDAVGGVRRSFVPRGVYERVTIGEPAAEAPVAPEAPAPPRWSAWRRSSGSCAPRRSATRCWATRSPPPSSCWRRWTGRRSMPMVRIGEALIALGTSRRRSSTRRWRSSGRSAACRWANCWCAAAPSRAPTCSGAGAQDGLPAGRRDAVRGRRRGTGPLPFRWRGGCRRCR
jgi:hypothetical protein